DRVVSGRMVVVSPRGAPRGEPPARFAVALESAGIRDAMGTVDPHVAHVLLPIVGVLILEPARIETAKRIVREEQRPPVRHAERQLDAVPRLAVAKSGPARETSSVDLGLDRVTQGRGREQVSDQALVPAANRVIHGPAVVRAPMPVEHLLAAAREPAPLHFTP